MERRAVMWTGERSCNFCGKEGLDSLVDGRTEHGYWAVMCDLCFILEGVGLGTGRGQRYISDGKGNMVKITGQNQ